MTLRKPAHVFDRAREWSGLTRFVESDSADVRFGVVSGRRRQGKTYLLDALTTEVGGFFFAATESTERESLARFGESLAAHVGVGGRFDLATWDEALERLYAAVPSGLIVIDELPYLVRANPALPSLLQRVLDPGGAARRSEARLLVCGSAMSVMGSLLAERAPLRGRASLELVVHPLDYRTAARFWGIDDPRLAVLVHAVVGGTPAYRREFVAGDAPSAIDDFDSWVVRAVLNPQVPLFREARYLLAEETGARDVGLYHAVLGAIASGRRTRGGVADHLGRKSTDIGHPLTVLEDARLIEREPDPFRRGQSSYRVCEPLITFYEAVMRRQWTRLDRGDADGAWQSSQATFRSQVVGPHFEQICRDWAAGATAAEAFGGDAGQVAPGLVNDPAARHQIQVDVAVLAHGDGGPRRVLSLGEAKWDEVMTPRHLVRLRRARDLLAAKGFDAADAILACYSGAGFDRELRAVARDDRRVVLIDLDMLYR